jgi:putative ABC transport system permease protein
MGAFATEFLLLGLVAGFFSSVIGSIAAMGILKGLMKTDFTLHPGTILVTIMLGVAMTLSLGLFGTWRALGHKPAEYLREE